ncbi:MAG: lysylphosphatidylglycerol synthase domain-containing protein [Mycoplasmoidaceae bacterium]
MNDLEKADITADKNNFFTKKRVTILFITTIFVIVFSISISIFLLEIDINAINNFFIEGFKQENSMFFLWLFLMFFFPFFASFWRYIVIYTRIKKENCNAKWYDWIFLIFIGSFLNAITPFSIGNEPYSLFWLKTHGLTTRKSLLILASTGIVSSFTQILITWPSFFVVSASYGNFGNTIEWSLGYWLAFAGLIFDLIGFFLFFALTYSRRIHYFLNRLYYAIRKKLRMSYKTKEDIKIKYIQRAIFKQEFIDEIKNYKFYSFVLTGNIILNIILYSTMFFSFKLSGINVDIKFWDWFNYTNIAVTANNWVPIPGSEGTLQILILAFMNGINSNINDIWKENINTIIFVWRIFTFYLSAVIGMICFPISAGLFYKGIKNNLK